MQRWISKRVATGVMPLLVQACSNACIETIPDTTDSDRLRPHRG